MSRSLGAGQLVHMRDYLSRRVQSVRDELNEIERLTAMLMRQLIREKDQNIARRLQTEIGRLDAKHGKLQKQLKSEEARQLLYAES